MSSAPFGGMLLSKKAGAPSALAVLLKALVKPKPCVNTVVLLIQLLSGIPARLISRSATSESRCLPSILYRSTSNVSAKE